MLVNIVQCTGQLPATKNQLSPDVVCAEVEKPCGGLSVPATVTGIPLIASLPDSNVGFPIHRGLGSWLIKLAKTASQRRVKKCGVQPRGLLMEPVHSSVSLP